MTIVVHLELLLLLLYLKLSSSFLCGRPLGGDLAQLFGGLDASLLLVLGSLLRRQCAPPIAHLFAHLFECERGLGVAQTLAQLLGEDVVGGLFVALLTYLFQAERDTKTATRLGRIGAG